MRAFRRAPVLWLAALLAAVPAVASGPAPATSEPVAAPAPQTASPGSPDRILRVAARCPTFSWSAQPAATGYELVVYRLPEEEPSEASSAGPQPAATEEASVTEEASLALRVEVPIGVSSWTPSLDRCLESGPRYAWLVRAWAGGEPTRWSEARLFEVDAVIVRSELEEVLRGVLARYFGAGTAPEDGASSDSPSALAASAPPPSGPSAGLTGSSQLHVPVGQTGIYSELPAGATDPGSSAILGESLASAGPTYGVRGITVSTQTPVPSGEDPANRSAGVRGEASAGAAYGVLGITTSSNLGQQADRARGVFGKAVAAKGVAIEGQSSSLSTAPDVEDSLGTGVRGVSVFAGGRGVEGIATGANSGSTPATGVYGKSTSGRGVWGAAGSGAGVFGASVSGVGVRADGVTADVEVAGSGRVRATNTLRLESVGDSVVLLPNDSLRLDAGGIEVVGSGSNIVISGDGKLEVAGGGNIEVSGGGKFIGDGSALNGVTVNNLNCSPARCVDTTDIAVGAVTSTEIAEESILSADIKNGEISSVDIKDGQVFSLDLAEDSFNLKQRDSAQAGVTNVLTLTHLLEDPENGSAGIGTGLLFQAEDSAGNPDSMGRIAAVFTDASDGSEGGELQFFARNAIALVKVMTVDEAGVDLGAKTLDTTGAVTAGSFAGDGSGLSSVAAATAAALAANGANCAAGLSPLGVDAVGAVESCFDVATQVELNAQATANTAAFVNVSGDTMTGGLDISAAAGLTLQNDETITNPTNDLIRFSDGTDTFDIDLTGSVSLKAGDSDPGTPVTLAAGNAVSGNNNGGNITLDPGDASGSGTDGVVNVSGDLTATGTVTAGSFAGDGSGLSSVAAATAAALAANGANCATGLSPLGVDAVGAVESCFDVATQVELNAQATANTAAFVNVSGDTMTGGLDISAAAGLTLQNDETITNPTNDLIRFSDGTDTFDIDLTGSVKLVSSSTLDLTSGGDANDVSVTAADATTTDADGGDINLTPGAGDGNGSAGNVDVFGTLRAIKNNATSLRLRGSCDANAYSGDDGTYDATCQSYAGVFHSGTAIGGPGSGARRTRAIYGSNPGMDLVLQGSNHIQIVAVDDIGGIGKVIIQAEDEIEFHAFDPPYGPDGGNAESRNLIATIDSDGLRLLPRANAPATPCTQGRLYADASGALCFCAVASWENLASGGTCT